MKRVTVFVISLICIICDVKGQIMFKPEVHGTIRSKYEYKTEDEEGRFEVRNARISFTGNVIDEVSYKAEVDLCNEGKIKMLDAYTRIKPIKRMSFTIGQMRVPFTIDAHRSPHLQYFANRSFIAKQVGNVRDVGASLGYNFDCGFPIVAEVGLFNGSGLTNQADYWTKSINYSGKIQFIFPKGYNLTLSTQKIKPGYFSIYMYDIGAYYHSNRWHIEAEYLLKKYSHNSFDNVSAIDAFVNYDIPVRNSLIKKVSPLVRYDYMTDKSDGKGYLDGVENKESGVLIANDYRRHRVTTGVTLSLSKPFITDIRLNYENYFYRSGASPKVSERDKIVIEFMTRF